MADYWLASGHAFCDLDPQGRLLATSALWRAFLARPELVPPEEACAAERALHAGLLHGREGRDLIAHVGHVAGLVDPVGDLQ